MNFIIDDISLARELDAQDELVAVARIRLEPPPALVSRIVVRADLRGRGVGSALMGYVHVLLGNAPATMSAQAQLETWYRRLGWTREGRVYDDAGLPHVRMVWHGK